MALALNELVRSGECGPLALGRDHMDPASVASPSRETEGMLDGSDAIADWPVLSALLNAAQGASWVAIGNGGGVGVGRSIHSGMVVVADGTELAERKIRRVFWTDPALGSPAMSTPAIRRRSPRRSGTGSTSDAEPTRRLPEARRGRGEPGRAGR